MTAGGERGKGDRKGWAAGGSWVFFIGGGGEGLKGVTGVK